MRVVLRTVVVDIEQRFNNLSRILPLIFVFPGELHVGILFVKVFMEEVNFVFVYCCESVINVA